MLRSRFSAAATVAGVLALGITVYAAIVPVTPDAAGASLLANAIAADPSIVTGASFQAIPAAGTPHAVATTPLSSFPTNGGTFAILTSGNASLADDANVADDSGANLGGLAVRGDTDRDVTVLAIDLNVPATSNCLTFDFQFYSEEYPEWLNNLYNDAFIAELDSSTWTTSATSILAPNNFAFDPSGDVISINSTGNTAFSAANAAGTTYDGATPLLSASTQITPGAHTLYLSIFDQGDQILDSAVFVDNLVVGFVPDPEVNCVPGAVPKLYTLSLTPATEDNPEDTEHTVTATLLELGLPLAGATIDFGVTGAHTDSGTGVTDGAGQTTFTYLGPNPGSDIITACYDADDNGTCEAVASAQKHWIDVNEPPAAACSPTTNPAGSTVPGANASASAGMNADGFYVLNAVDTDGTAAVFVADTGSSFVAGPFAPGTQVKVTQTPGSKPHVQTMAGGTYVHIFLNGDARVYAEDDDAATSADVFCYVPRPPK